MKHALRLCLPVIILMASAPFLIGCDKEDSALQDQCAKQCEAYFKQEYGDGVFDNHEGAGAVSYKSHHNRKLNKCFMVLDENGYKRKEDKLYELKTLWDMKEKGKIGVFYNIGKSTECIVLDKKCSSEDEWDNLVKPYMKE